VSHEKAEWPEVGDLVIVTVKSIAPYGAYVTLDEYGDKEGLLHISEVSSSWVKNIRDHVREGQKTVLKVLRVDQEKKHVDLSLRRVSGAEKKEKLFQWKRDRKAESLLKIAAERLNMPLEELSEKAALKIMEKYGSLYVGMEEASEKGVGVLIESGVPEKIAGTLTEIAHSKIRIPRVKIRGILELSSTAPNVAEIIRDTLIAAKNLKMPRDADVGIYVVGAPRYRVEVSAKDYKEAEKLLQRIFETAIQSLEKSGGQGSFKRE
jgi:translation initiation factor 2 subunit 1